MKQIYASLEFSENEIRLLVGEYFNTRFNVIKLERVPCEGLTNCRITDHDNGSASVIRVEEMSYQVNDDKQIYNESDYGDDGEDYNDNGTEVEVGPGDVTFCDAEEGHALKNIGDEDLEAIALILYK